MLFPIRPDCFLIDKVPDLAEAVFIPADSGENFSENLHNQAFLLTLVKIKDSGFNLFKRHGYSPSQTIISPVFISNCRYCRSPNQEINNLRNRHGLYRKYRIVFTLNITTGRRPGRCSMPPRGVGAVGAGSKPALFIQLMVSERKKALA
jgi:hypothetical protein